ncbi:MAG TPA: caspase family protein, partial [Polyangia bacterium]|nr:caspase family protein [Polyangia bacterium]
AWADEGRGASTGSTRRFALVVGNNLPPHAGLARLRYADDDAVRWAVTLDALGADVEVLAELDDESRQLYGPLSFKPSPPTSAELSAAVGRLAARVSAARSAGAHVILYFVYAGHGDVEDGHGYVALADGRLTRDELGTIVLARLGADTNHVIIDACRASSFLGDRGPGGERRPWQDAYFAPNAPRIPHTGFLLASSSSGLSHEWEEFQAGVFSHEVRSGILGAADANGDGLVTYDELTGFVRLANLPIKNERFRPQIVSRRPAESDVLVDLRAARPGSLTLDATQASAHELLEDRAGVRWADFHLGASARIHLILPSPAWSSEGFYLRSMANDREYAVPAGRDVRLADLAATPERASRRGALTDAFTHLFDLPFDQGALDLLNADAALRVDAHPSAPDSDWWTSRSAKIAGIAATAAGGASLAVAGGFSLSALGVQHTADHATGAERVGYNQEIDSRNRWAAATAVGGGLLVAAGIGLLLWRRHAIDSAPSLW